MNEKYDLEDGVEGPRYAVVEVEEGKYAPKYMGHLKEGDNVKDRNLRAKQAIKICNEHNEQLSGRAEIFRDEHSIERTVSDSDIRGGVTDHHGRQAQ